MWAPRYWAVRYWAPRYWTPGAGGITPTPPKQGQEIYFLRSVGKLMNN